MPWMNTYPFNAESCPSSGHESDIAVHGMIQLDELCAGVVSVISHSPTTLAMAVIRWTFQ